MSTENQTSIRRGLSADRLMRGFENLAWITGAALMVLYLSATVHAALASDADIRNFKKVSVRLAETDQALWSDSRKQAYGASLQADMGLPEALLSIPAINLRAPVWAGIDEVTLNRAVGRVPETPETSESGNTVLAAHRDGFFRRLGELEISDEIEIETLGIRHVYRVKNLMIVEPDATHVMNPSEESMLTLITCYPFYFVGPAPKRFVVQAVRETTERGNR